MIRLLVVDDDRLVRSGLRVLLCAEPGLVVVGEAGDGAAAVERCAAGDIDVVLMDVRMAGMDGIEATRGITAQSAIGTRVLVVTTFTEEEYVFAALAAGASGFVPKSAHPEQLVQAIRIVASGDALVLPTEMRQLVERSIPPGHSRSDPRRKRLDRLTPREAEVLRLVAGGLSNTDIAKELFIGAETVKSHIGSMLAKIGARDRTQAVIFAYETGFVRVSH